MFPNRFAIEFSTALIPRPQSLALEAKLLSFFPRFCFCLAPFRSEKANEFVEVENILSKRGDDCGNDVMP